MDYIKYELPLEEAFVLHGWAVINEPINRFSGVTVVNSPIERESKQLLSELKEMLQQQAK